MQNTLKYIGIVIILMTVTNEMTIPVYFEQHQSNLIAILKQTYTRWMTSFFKTTACGGMIYHCSVCRYNEIVIFAFHSATPI